MSRFSREDSIFRSESPFRESYQPDELLERDEELDEYANALNPIIKGEPPKNILLYGKTGVGKTAATNVLLDELQEEADNWEDIDLSIFHVSCRKISSSYQAATQIINTIRDHTGGERIPSTGYPRHEVFNILFEELENVGGTVILVLDEIDNIGTDDDLLYELPRANANNELEDVEPGIIGISNDFGFKDQLSAEVKGTLCDEEIVFPPYDATQLRTILEERAEEGFHDDVVSESEIVLCAALAAQDKGSARQALRLLHKSGELARDRDGVSEITEQHVRDAKKRLERDRVKEALRELTMQAHLVLCSMVELSLNDETPARTKDIYERYTQVTERVDTNELVERRMYDHLSALERHGFLEVDTKNEGGHGGRYHEYEIDVDLNMVLDTLEDSTTVRELVTQYQELAERTGAAKPA